MGSKYADMSHDQLVKLLEARDRRKKLGLVWERDEIPADRRRNADFVACELGSELINGIPIWTSL